MFKEFWDAKKHLIEFVGILSGVGALFLAIPIPQNDSAKQALLNIQFVWLVLITIAVVILFSSLVKFVDRVEKTVKAKHSYDITDTFSYLISLGLLWLLANLWRYVAALYEKPLLVAWQWIAWTIIIIAVTGLDYFLNKHNKWLPSIHIRNLVLSFGGSLFMVAMYVLLPFPSRFNWGSAKLYFLVGFCILLVLTEIKALPKNRK